LTEAGTTGLVWNMSWVFARPSNTGGFLQLCPIAEKYIVDGGTILIKYWMEVGQKSNNVDFRLALTIPSALEAQPNGLGVVSTLVRILSCS